MAGRASHAQTGDSLEIHYGTARQSTVSGLKDVSDFAIAGMESACQGLAIRRSSRVADALFPPATALGNGDDGKPSKTREAKVAVFHTAERSDPKTGLPERDAGSARHTAAIRQCPVEGHRPESCSAGSKPAAHVDSRRDVPPRGGVVC